MIARVRRLLGGRHRGLVIGVLVLVVLIVTAMTITLVNRDPGVRTASRFLVGVPEPGEGAVELDTTLYLPASTPAPAVLLAHGFGGSKRDLTSQATSLARHGYVVLAYTARGFGRSGGLVHLDAPAFEVADAQRLVSYLATLPEVSKDSADNPRVGVAGASYGGGLALMLAGTDPRVDAVGADIAWNDLSRALFPNATGEQPGVFKKLWAGYLFQAAYGSRGAGGGQCGRFAAEVCAEYQRAASSGMPDAAILALLRASSPVSVVNKIRAPTLLSQGEQDSLFPLGEADANARGIAANGTPVRVIWRSGGHDGGGVNDDVRGQVQDWFDAHLRNSGTASTSFELAERGAALSATNGRRIAQTVRVDGYPGLSGAPAQARTITLAGGAQAISAPAGGNPAAVTTLPQIGGILDQALSALGGSQLEALASIPGQVATFSSAPLRERLLLAGAPTVRLTVTPRTSTDATLFVAVHDIASDGSDVLPSGLVAPLRLTGLTAGRAITVQVTLPSVVRAVASGHRLALTVATTDLAYQLPADARSYTVALDGASAPLTLPTVTGTIVRAGHPLDWLITGLAVIAAVVAVLALGALRRRRAGGFDPALRDVPIAVTDLVKEYSDGYRAVDGVTFRVEQGQVVGLLGPNGAGKTTTLRVLVGLIRPTSGQIHVFGRPISPGVAVLSRIGAFIEGPGFLPHLSGRENLRLFWAASGRPAAVADMDTALEIAGLGASIERRVKTYSHGMRQRLAIAQAMLGLPELLVLDEPTNGLDPPQIAEMREVLQRYAETGRTVVVSSHLLAEVEQTCTHVVVMHKGRLITAGSVSEIAGPGGMQLAVDDPAKAAAVLADAGITTKTVPARRALEDVFLDLVGGDP
ncbi:MAG: alpha/beta fold hydrolase [Actinomycetota bacterium]